NGSDRICNVFSKGYDVGFQIDLKAIARSKVEWENYILGVLNEISQKTDKVRGFDCTIESYLPIGSGVSSSAALECGLAYGLNELFDLGLAKLEIVELSQRAEHTFVGTKGGIMDQFASVMGKKGNAILLDCESMEYEYIPIDLDPYKILLLNSNVSHNLATGEYNTRRAECEAGVAVLKKYHPAINSLRMATEKMIREHKDEMGSKVFDRCLYIVQEEQRVLNAVEALKSNNLQKLGSLLYQTHDGLSNLYEVSCPELDFLVDFSKTDDTVLGARLMGGGFGGCTINLVHGDAVESYIQRASKAYREKFGIELTAFEALPSKGTSVK